MFGFEYYFIYVGKYLYSMEESKVDAMKAFTKAKLENPFETVTVQDEFSNDIFEF